MSTSMTIETTDTLVIGGGQAGIATSEHLSNLGVDHLVLERSRIAEHWRTMRWDSLVANGPAWHDRFPGLEFEGVDPDGFASKERTADYFVEYAAKFKVPIREGVAVTNVVRNEGRPGFTIETSQGTIEANHVVVATGPFQNPAIPPIAKQYDNITQIHSSDYKNPQQLPEGGVLVIGAGSSGVQIADELQRAGKEVYLSVGAHDRLPRRYRNRDFVWWLGVLGLWDQETLEPGREHVTIAVTGAHGGYTINFREMAHQGIKLVGLTKAFEGNTVSFNADLNDNVKDGNDYYLSLLDAADAYIERNGLDLPEEPEARNQPADPECMTNPIMELDMVAAGITNIIWATGFSTDYSWLQVDAFNEQGKPQHQRGVSSEAGVYFVGLPWLSRRGSTFIWGVWHDAKHVAGHIATQHKYTDYRDPSQK